MLVHLAVRNLAILEEASIEPGPGLSVITGETGTGKTLLLGALRLLMGEKAKSSLVGPFGDEMDVQGLVTDSDGDVGFARRVPRQGRSRAYVEGNVVSAEVLAETMGAMVEIVGQNDHLSLRNPSVILGLVDERVSRDDPGVLDDYGEAWSEYRAAMDARDRLGGNRMSLERELDLLRYQAAEIAAARLEDGDDARMEAMAKRLRNAGAIRESLDLAIGSLQEIAEHSGSLVSSLRNVGALDDNAGAIVAASEGYAEEAVSLLRDVNALAANLAEDPGALEEIEDRLNLAGDLKRKYGKTLKDVLEFGVGASRRGDEIQGLLDRSANLDAEIRRATESVSRTAAALSAARTAAGDRIAADTRSHLGDLGLAKASCSVVIEPVEPGPRGADRVRLMFSSDDRLDPGDIALVASGGELSRIVLAIRLATRVTGNRTLVFDEIDSGVGGATALALGEKLANLARESQVICVTHLPQIAAHAQDHYVVDRSGASASVRRVAGEQRVRELSRMLAGLPDSDGGREIAVELLSAADA